MERPPDSLHCSFCAKSQSIVRKLIAGPSVYICDECVEICVDIITEDRRLTDSVAAPYRSRESDTSALSASVVLCALCRLPFPPEDLVIIPNRGPLCHLCVDAVVITQSPATQPE
jgi:hypothetical protein